MSVAIVNKNCVPATSLDCSPTRGLGLCAGAAVDSGSWSTDLCLIPVVLLGEMMTPTTRDCWAWTVYRERQLHSVALFPLEPSPASEIRM